MIHGPYNIKLNCFLQLYQLSSADVYSGDMLFTVMCGPSENNWPRI